MKTVFIDNSLSVNAFAEHVDPHLIYSYIEALADAGIKYVEIDFRTAMLLPDLPKGIGYVFRLLDPMFLDIADAFNFDYVLVTLGNLKEGIKTDVPVMLELPASDKLPRPAVRYAADRIEGTIAAVRLVSNYALMTPQDAGKYVLSLKNNVPVPFDICPLNGGKAALDSVFKFTNAGIDSITMTVGLSNKFASFEDFLLTMMSVYSVPPENFDIPALCKALLYHKRIFKKSKGDSFTHLLSQLEKDVSGLINADTGARVQLGLSLKESQCLKKHFATAFEKMAESEDIPDDVAAELIDAVKYFDKGIYNPDLLNTPKKKLLN